MDNFSYAFGLPDHHHASLDFADVQVGTDNRLFVDPARIHLAALAGYSWAMEADALIQSFFNTLYDAAAQRDFEAVRNLTIDTCGELNETQLGLSRGAPRGNGASFPLIFSAVYQMVEDGLFEKDAVNSIADIPVLADRIDADRLSDWTTNIIWPVLRTFTFMQYEKYGLTIHPTSCVPRLFWDADFATWRETSSHDLSCNGKRIWLCPKPFLHKRLLMSTEKFLKEQVIEYRQTVHLDNRSDLCRQKELKDGSTILMAPYKKDVYNAEIRGNSHTQYARNYAKECPSLLHDYHHGFEYQPGKASYFISDEELDEILYTKN